MIRKIDYLKEDQIDYAKLYDESEEIAFDVNHIVRVNGSSAFAMPKPPERKLGLFGRVVDRVSRS